MLTPGAARVVLPCEDLTESIDFFVDLGFVLDNIWPADDPMHAILSVPGIRIELRRGAASAVGTHLVVPSGSIDDGHVRHLRAPNGTTVELVPLASGVEVPAGQSSLVVSTLADETAWVTGRAGMRYRDLLPDRWGGRYIASHIEIPDGGPVPDYVHFHDVRFQMIFCANGWVRVLYEDQGESFVLQRGDCVLQPPLIRHRVLEASPGLEVVEIGCPAEHLTTQEHTLELPTASVLPDRDFGGQRFVRHVADGATYLPWRSEGFECRDTGIRNATDAVADVHVARPAGATETEWLRSHDDFLLFYVLGGGAHLETEHGGAVAMDRSASVAIPQGHAFRLTECTPDLELLEIIVNP